MQRGTHEKADRIFLSLEWTGIFPCGIGIGQGFAASKQEHVHHLAHSVMPFDMSKTEHIFRMTEYGGVQKVIARNPDDTDQIILIQQHLRHEAAKFQQGDYSDPAKLHGADMPGLKELQAGAAGGQGVLRKHSRRRGDNL